MSGNMSFLNNSEGSIGESVRESARHNGNRNAERAAPNVSSFLDRRARDSTISEPNTSCTSFQEEAGRQLEPEIILDKDVWATRIILSALENIVFAETPFPKISPGVLQAMQKFILSVNSAVSNVNPFVEFAESVSGSLLEHSDFEKMSSTHTGISKEVMDALDKGTPENKVVIRSLVMGYIRNTVAALIEQMKTMLALNSASAEPSAIKKRPESSPAAGLLKLKTDFGSIIDAIKSLMTQSVEMDDEIRELLKQRDEELKKFNRDVKQLKDITVDILKLKSAEQEPEFVKQYLDFVKLENEHLTEQLRFEKLQIEAEENPEDLRKETSEVYRQLKNQYDNMLTETTTMEDKLQKYQQLGNEYLKILEKYNAVEEEIKTKEWVKEQLQNAPRDDSLFSDSFYE